MTLLTDLRENDTILLGLTIVSRSAAGYVARLNSTEKAVLGTLALNTDLTMVGTIAAAPNTIPVTILGRAFQVGDVAVSDTTGETLVVRSVWVTLEGWRWSSSTNRAATYKTDGWTVVGSATLT